MTEPYKGNWIMTSTGKKFYPLDPRQEDIDENDIAHALGNICRFTGHCRSFYSVAQHSVLGSHFFEDPLVAAAFLLHDASEAYICDVSFPVKTCADLGDYKTIEADIQRVVYDKYEIPSEYRDLYHSIDRRMAITEGTQLMHQSWKDDRYEDIDLLSIAIVPWSPQHATIQFLARGKELQLW